MSTGNIPPTRVGVRPEPRPDPLPPEPPLDGEMGGGEQALTWAEFLRWARDWGPPEKGRAPIHHDALDEAAHRLAGAAARASLRLVEAWALPLGSGPEGEAVRGEWARELGPAVAAAAHAAQELTPGALEASGAVRAGFIAEEHLRALVGRVAGLRGIPDAMLGPGSEQEASQEVLRRTSAWVGEVMMQLVNLASAAGELCEFVAMLRWDRVDPSPEALEVGAMAPLQALKAAQRLGILAGAGALDDILWAYMAAFERRYPEGWRPGGGLLRKEQGP